MMREGDIFAGRYRLIRRLGIGGFSVVWLVADQLADDMELAVKIYAPERGMDEAGLKLFRKEYVLTAAMRHEGLLKAMHFDVNDGSPYLVMPFCEKGSLAVRLLDEGPMSEREVADALMQMSSALAYLHARDVMHGDIKPDNVLIDGQGRYLLCDFGISSKLRNTLRKSTESSKALTVAYSPPERFKGSGNAGPGGDVFALGVALYEMLSCELPWGGIGGVYLTPDSVAPVPPGTQSDELNQLVCSCMHYDPQRRPSASQLHAAAEHYTRTGRWDVPAPPPVTASRKTEQMPNIPPPPPGAAPPAFGSGNATLPGASSLDPRTGVTHKEGNSKAAIWIIGGLVVLALGAGLWWNFGRSTDDDVVLNQDSVAQAYIDSLMHAAASTLDSTSLAEPASADTVAPPVQMEQEPVAEVQQENSDRLTGLVDSDGDTYDYEGEIRSGKPHGQGRGTYRTGTVKYYDGAWRNGIRHGRGKMVWDDGDKYDGAWENGSRTGRGTYWWNSGGKYVGDWVEAQMHGSGTYTWKDGDTYVGQWYENMMEGEGTYTVIDGTVANCEDCKKYTGGWEDDKKKGWGRCYAGDGSLLYEGSFADDRPTGTYPTGSGGGAKRINQIRN